MNEPVSDRVKGRSEHLLPEERSVGSEDATAQAAAILNDSDAREAYVETAPDLRIDHRQSDETVDPDPA